MCFAAILATQPAQSLRLVRPRRESVAVREGETRHGRPPALASVYYVITCDRVSLVAGEQMTFTADDHPSGCSDNSFRMDVLIEKHTKITALVEGVNEKDLSLYTCPRC